MLQMKTATSFGRDEKGDNMGQRLVILIHESEKEDPIAAVYLHWSAYTTSAYEETGYLLSHLAEAKCQTKEDWQKEIVATYLKHCYPDESCKRIAEWKGKHGGICIEDAKLAKGLWPDLNLDMDNLDRNLGLVAITPEQVYQFRIWSEGNAHIYLDTMTANIEVFFDSPASQWFQGEDGKWHNPEMYDDEYYYLPDSVWKNLRLIQTNDLSVDDIRASLDDDAKKISDDGWALADNGRTVVEIIQ